MIRNTHGAKTLPQSAYVSQDVFKQELRRIFAQQWLCIGRTEQLPHSGHYWLCEALGESIIVLRDKAAIRAFYNVCRHRGTRLCTENGRFPQTIQCPYHAWTYALDGRLLGAPNMHGVAGFDTADYPLAAVATAVWEGFIFINLTSDPVPFATAYAPILTKFSDWQLDQLVIGHEIVYDVAANWKLIFQNYSECYHCPTVHPALNALTPYKNSSNDLEEGPILGGPMQLDNPQGSMTRSGRRCAPPLGNLSGADLGLVYYYTLFPTMFISLHPDYVLVHRLEATAVDRTRIVCQWLFAPETAVQPNFDPSDAVDFWHQTNQEDWEMCQRSQAGIQSRAYTPGPYSNLESVLAAFDREYRRIMGSDFT